MLTYRDTALLSSAGAELSFTRNAWWMKDKNQQLWYVTETYTNQYIQFQEVYRTSMTEPRSMSREEFEERFNAN